MAAKAIHKIYWNVLVDSYRAAIKNWRLVFAHLLILVAVALLSPISGLLGSFAGGFFMGILLSIALAAFLGTVQSAVNNERMRFDDIWPRTVELLSPVIGVLFALFIVSIISQILIPRDAQWVGVAMQLLICVLFNPLFEAVYLEEGSTTELFQASFELIKSKFIEWMAPYLAILLPLFFIKPHFVETVAMAMFTTNPIYLVGEFMALVGNLSALRFLLPVLPVFLIGIYFAFIFRGKLYMQLIRR